MKFSLSMLVSLFLSSFAQATEVPNLLLQCTQDGDSSVQLTILTAPAIKEMKYISEAFPTGISTKDFDGSMLREASSEYLRLRGTFHHVGKDTKGHKTVLDLTFQMHEIRAAKDTSRYVRGIGLYYAKVSGFETAGQELGLRCRVRTQN